MCPPQPSNAHWYELLTMSVYHSARSVLADGVNFKTDLYSSKKTLTSAHGPRDDREKELLTPEAGSEAQRGGWTR